MTNNDDSLPPILEQALSLDFSEEQDEAQQKEIELRRRNCPQCGGIATVQKDMGYMYTNAPINLSINIPAHICSGCDAVVFEPKDFKTILEAEEKAQGRHYIKVEIKGGKVHKYSLH